MKNTVILYHNNCQDGFGAAWAAWKKFGSSASYIAVNHQEPPPRGLKNKNVYILDFSYPFPVIKKLLKIAASLTVIDHHISAASVVKSVPDHIFALNHSGAVLAWKYFHPKKPVPKALLHIEDGDLWRFKLPLTHVLRAALENYDYNFSLWNKIALNWQSLKLRKKYINEGRMIIKYQNRLIKEIYGYAEKVNFLGYRTLAVNSSVSNLASQIAYALYKKIPPIAIVWYNNGKRINVSLRSNGKVDVSKLAARFGGGGHKAAAGFSWSLNKPLPWKYV